MSRPRKRIVLRLVLAFIVPTAVVMLFSAWLTLRSARHTFEQQFVQQVDRLAATLASQIDVDKVLSLLPGDEEQSWYIRLANTLQEQARAADLQRLIIIDSQGRVFVDADRKLAIDSELKHFRDHHQVIQRALKGESDSWVTGSVDQIATLRAYKKLDIKPIEGLEDEVLLLVIETRQQDEKLLKNYANSMIPLNVLSLLAMVLIAVFVARGITKPLSALTDEAQRLGLGDFQHPVSMPGRKDEIAFLAKTLEEMRSALLRRDRDRQVMLASIAHEVRNPLAGIELFLGLLREGLQELLDEQQALEPEPAQVSDDDEEDEEGLPELIRYSKRIQRELSYLTGVVNDFLSFAREMPMQTESVDAAELLAELRQSLQADAVAVGLDVLVEVDAGLVVQADRGSLHRALLNVGQNAIQASPAGAQIILRAVSDDDSIAFSVEDHGAGIPKDKLQDILTPFFTTKQKGTGLGLALVDKIVRAHCGQLKIDSEAGQGTTMILRIPKEPGSCGQAREKSDDVSVAEE